MPLDAKTIVQILVLTVGIHVVLSFLRETRGSGLIRGVAVALIVIFGGLLGVARYFELPELLFIVQSVSGFVVVILAIVFQPELRRGIVSLGDSPLLRRVIGSRAGDSVDEVAAACVAMAKRKQGALIAFERQTSLDPYAQTAVKIDGRVQRDLLDSIFHTGGALHDGAVILREDRIACAMAILPLSENDQLASSVGTRHRAALGLTEETDAVVVAVSEETGLISVFQGGQMERRVLRDELSDVLRARLGGDAVAEPQRGQKASPPVRAARAFVSNPVSKVISLLLAVGLFFLASRSIRTTETYQLLVTTASGADANLEPTRGSLRIVLPSADLHLASPLVGEPIDVEVGAARADLDTLQGGLGGVLVVDTSWVGSERPIPIGDVVWGAGREMRNLEISFASDESPRVRIEEYRSAEIEPSIASLAASPEDAEADRFERILLPTNTDVGPDSLEFNPSVIVIRGPSEEVDRIRGDSSLLTFVEVDVQEERGTGFVERLEIDRTAHPEIEIVGDLFLRGALVRREKEITTMELDVALVTFDASVLDDTTPYLPPTETVTVRVFTRGIFPDDVDDETRTVMVQELVQFVRDRARVFVDVGRADETPGSRAVVEVDPLDPLWRTALSPYFETASKDPYASLRLDIDEADKEIALVRREPNDDDDQ